VSLDHMVTTAASTYFRLQDPDLLVPGGFVWITKRFSIPSTMPKPPLGKRRYIFVRC
jgi:hypothetical protein